MSGKAASDASVTVSAFGSVRTVGSDAPQLL